MRGSLDCMLCRLHLDMRLLLFFRVKHAHCYLWFGLQCCTAAARGASTCQGIFSLPDARTEFSLYPVFKLEIGSQTV